MTHPWLVGYRRPLFWQDWWQYVDIDTRARRAAERASDRDDACSRELLVAARPRAARWRSAHAGAAPRPPAPQKVLRYAFEVAETSFDPAQVSDLYSRTRHAAHLRGASTATTTWRGRSRSSRSRPRRCPSLGRLPHLDREASGPASTSPTTRRSRASSASWSPQDYVYSLKRFADPANKSPVWAGLEDEQAARPGRAARGSAATNKQPFDYDREIEGLRALDRYTLQFRLAEPRPRFTEHARRQRPVRRGGARGGRVLRRRSSTRTRSAPARSSSSQWRRSSRIVLERNPGYRDVRYDAEPAADDAEGQALLRALQGPAAADGRPRRDLDHRGEPAALAVVPAAASSTC